MKSIALFVLLCVFATISNAALADKPNIVVILADDLGCMDVGAFNPKTFYETPYIDSLAKRGMKFTQGYGQTPSPTERESTPARRGDHLHGCAFQFVGLHANAIRDHDGTVQLADQASVGCAERI